MEFMDVVAARRSVRKFQPDPIPEDVLEQILEAGRIAPSAMNMQNWRFGVITDQAVKDRLVAVCGDQEWISSAPVIIALCTQLSEDIQTLPADDINLLVPLARYGQAMLDHLNAFDDRRAVRMLLDWRNVIYAGQQMVLAAENFGIRSCWVGYIDTAKADEVLGLPEDVICELLLPMGYPAEEPELIERKSIDDIVFHEKWDG